MDFSAIKYEIIDQVALITLNRPEQMNAWNAAMASELSSALDQANRDDEARAVVITGAGRAFCAGADLQRGEDTFAGREDQSAEETTSIL